MVTQEISTVTISPEERALLLGDLSKLGEQQRADLIGSVCRSIGINPLTRPLQYITLNGKLTLYATKDCTDQLRKLHRVSTQIVGRELAPGDIYIVTARATTFEGRVEERIGAVSVKGLQGEALANSYMKAETKAVRRVSLAICGLGFLDESEVESIPGAQRTTIREEAPRQITAANGEMANTGREWQTHTAIADLVIMQNIWKELTGEIVTIPEGKSLAVLQRFQARWQEKIDAHRAAQQEEADPFPDVPNASASIRQPVAAAVLAEDDLPYND